jgi:hypothetical protein
MSGSTACAALGPVAVDKAAKVNGKKIEKNAGLRIEFP